MISLRNILLVCITYFIASSPVGARTLGALLVLDDYSCEDFTMIFHDGIGYIEAEWYAGVYVENMVYFGEFNRYGIIDVYDQNGFEVGSVWIENYWISEYDASEACYGN